MTAKIRFSIAGISWLPDFMRATERTIDDSREMEVFTVATLPSAAAPFRWIHVSDETGGPTAAFNDGSNWKRVSDGATVS